MQNILILYTILCVYSTHVDKHEQMRDCKITHEDNFEYNGTLLHTRNGQACVPWADLNMTHESNYCRNAAMSYVMCYTQIQIFNDSYFDYQFDDSTITGYDWDYCENLDVHSNQTAICLFDHCDIPLCENHRYYK